MILSAFLPVEKVSQMSVFCLKRDSLAKKQEIGCKRYIDYQSVVYHVFKTRFFANLLFYLDRLFIFENLF